MLYSLLGVAFAIVGVIAMLRAREQKRRYAALYPSHDADALAALPPNVELVDGRFRFIDRPEVTASRDGAHVTAPTSLRGLDGYVPLRLAIGADDARASELHATLRADPAIHDALAALEQIGVVDDVIVDVDGALHVRFAPETSSETDGGLVVHPAHLLRLLDGTARLAGAIDTAVRLPRAAHAQGGRSGDPIAVATVTRRS